MSRDIPPPRKPECWTWAAARRLCGRTVVALTLLWVVALVGWPERRTWLLPAILRPVAGFSPPVTSPPVTSWPKDAAVERVESMLPFFGANVFRRDADLRVLWDALTE